MLLFAGFYPKPCHTRVDLSQAGKSALQVWGDKYNGGDEVNNEGKEAFMAFAESMFSEVL
jgi:hypothetical protein